MKRTIIRKASDIFDDEYESPAFIIEDEKQTKTGYWLVAESDQEYAQWYVDLPSARKAMKEEKIRSNAARALGSIKSPKKAAASRENGKLGGRPRGKQSIIDALNAGSDPADFGFDCRADDGQGNEYWCKNQGSVVVRLNCYTDPKTDKKYWDDDVSGWENQ